MTNGAVKQQLQKILAPIAALPPQRAYQTDIVIVAGDLGCLPASEVVYTPDGITTAGEVKEGMRIIGGTVHGVWRKEAEVYEVEAGRVKFRASGEHPLLVSKSPHWKQGSVRAAPKWTTVEECYNHQQESSANRRWNVCVMRATDAGLDAKLSIGIGLAKLLGYLMSDGSFSRKQSVKFTNVRQVLLQEVAELASECYPSLTQTLYAKGNGYDLLITNRDSYRGENVLKSKLQELGLTNRDSFGRLQGLVEEELVAFISGYFNGDGCLYVHRHKQRTRPTPDLRLFVGIHEKQARELQFMLWRLGVKSHVDFRHREKGDAGCWEVRVFQADSLKRLLGMLDPRKYPEKFEAAIKVVSSAKPYHKEDEWGTWVPINRITKVGKKEVIGWETDPTHEIVLASGIRTHNSGKTQLAVAMALFEAVQPSREGRQVYINFPLEIAELDRYLRIEKKLDQIQVSLILSRIHYVDKVYDFLAERRSRLQKNPLRPEQEGQDLFILDEAWEYAHGRESMSKKSIEFVGYVRLARKLGLEPFCTVQLKTSADKTIKVLATKNVLAERQTFYLGEDENPHYYYEYTVWARGFPRPETFYMEEEDAALVHRFYNSMIMQAPGATQQASMDAASAKAGVDEQRKKSQDIMQTVVKGLKSLNDKMDKNPFVDLTPQKARVFFDILEALARQAQAASQQSVNATLARAAPKPRPAASVAPSSQSASSGRGGLPPSPRRRLS